MYVRLRVSFPKLPRRFRWNWILRVYNKNRLANLILVRIPFHVNTDCTWNSNRTLSTLSKTDRATHKNNWNIPPPQYDEHLTKCPSDLVRFDTQRRRKVMLVTTSEPVLGSIQYVAGVASPAVKTVGARSWPLTSMKCRKLRWCCTPTVFYVFHNMITNPWKTKRICVI